MSPRFQFDYSGCRALITGGTSGIGAGIANAFIDAGADVIITGTRAAASEYGGELPRASYRQLRLTEHGDIAKLAEEAPTLDILINNAGANLPGGQSEFEPNVFEESVAINLFGAYRLTTALKPKLAKSQLDGGAAIVNMASMSAYFGIPFVPAYGAAKAGIVQLTKTLAVAWANERIRVNAVAPGFVTSRMTAPMQAIPQLAEPFLARTPMGRWGSPEEVASVVLFLAGPAARFVTGQTLAIDGGYSIS